MCRLMMYLGIYGIGEIDCKSNNDVEVSLVAKVGKGSIKMFEKLVGLDKAE